jgi:hypothetical protein
MAFHAKTAKSANMEQNPKAKRRLRAGFEITRNGRAIPSAAFDKDMLIKVTAIVPTAEPPKNQRTAAIMLSSYQFGVIPAIFNRCCCNSSSSYVWTTSLFET